MRHALTAVLLWFAASACADGVASHASDDRTAPGGPQLVIGPCHPAGFEGDTEVFTWTIAGTLRGRLQARLWRFADGQDELLSEAQFGTDELVVDGQLLVLLRDGAPCGRPGDRVVEIRMPMAAAQPVGSDRVQSSTTVAPLSVHPLPSSPNHAKTQGRGGTMVCLPNQYNAMEMWSQTHANGPAQVSFVTPWPVQRECLLRQCTNGVVTMVVTLEQLLDEVTSSSSRR